MPTHTKIVRNTGSFRVSAGKLLLVRVGPVSGQVQTHNRTSRNLVTGAKEPWNGGGTYQDYSRRAPERRGYWAFPYPFADAFFYHHVYERHLPKRLRDRDVDWSVVPEDEQIRFCAEKEATLAEIKQRLRPKLIWHAGPFYSHVAPKGWVGERPWYRYDNAREWIESARDTMRTWYNSTPGDPAGLWQCSVSKDHLELFVPD